MTSAMPRTEAERRESDELHDRIVQTALDGFVRADLAGRIREVNDAYCRMTGYSEQELLQLRISDLELSDSEQDVGERIQRLMKVGGDRFHSRHRRKDGTSLDVEVSVTYLESEGGCLVAFVRDTTRHLQVEQALLEGETQFRNLSENLADGMVYQIDSGPGGTERRFTYVSPAVERMHGLTVKQVMDDPMSLYGQVEEGAAREVLAAEAEAFRTLTRLDIDVPVLLPWGERRWRRFVSSPRRIPGGSLIWDGIETDITERVQADKEQEKLHDQLTQARKLESLGRLAGGIAHDFNNMLNVILCHAEMLREGLSISHPLRPDIDAIVQAANHSADLTQQLLAFARRQPVVPRVLNPNDEVEKIAGVLRRITGPNIALSWIPSTPIWQVKMDAGQLGQILFNLCANARDAVDQVPDSACAKVRQAGVCSGTVVVETANVVVDSALCAGLSDATPGEFVRLSVTDNGCGMDPETLARVFEPFFTTKAVGRGVGLGLATTYGIVRQNGGFVDVWSEPGKGTSFKIYLPRCLERPA